LEIIAEASGHQIEPPAKAQPCPPVQKEINFFVSLLLAMKL
jgi:hypothetical protein